MFEQNLNLIQDNIFIVQWVTQFDYSDTSSLPSHDIFSTMRDFMIPFIFNKCVVVFPCLSASVKSKSLLVLLGEFLLLKQLNFLMKLLGFDENKQLLALSWDKRKEGV